MSFVPSIVALSAMAAVALVLTLARGSINADSVALRSAVRMAILAIFCQLLHLAEEAGGELNRHFPEFWGWGRKAVKAVVEAGREAKPTYLD